MEFGGIRAVKETMEVKKQCEQKEHGSIIQSSLGHVPGEIDIHIPDSSNAPIVSLSKKVPTLID